MKRTFLIASLAILTVSVLAFRTLSKKGAAEVNQYEGIYVFTDCKPAAEYEYLGTVKPKGRGWDLVGGNTNQYTELRDRLIKAAKKEYKGAQGLILDLKDGGVDKADVIKFKD